MKNLQEFIKNNSIDVEYLVFEKSCHSVQEAAEAANASLKDFVKSICMVSENRPIIAIVRGEDRASTSRVEKALNIERPELATPEQILELTGYPCGGTPPFGFDATFLIDEKVMEMELIYAGGGTENSLIRINPDELKRVNNGIVARVRK